MKKSRKVVTKVTDLRRPHIAIVKAYDPRARVVERHLLCGNGVRIRMEA